MEIENEGAQVDTVEQEEQVSDEQFETSEDSSDEEETVTVTKSQFTKLKRKALAYDSKEKPKTQIITKSSDDKWKQKMELKVEGYDDEAVDFLMKNGGKKALENPYITAAIDSMKTKKAAEAATLGQDSSKSGIEKRYSPQQFAKLSHEDQLKALSELV